MSGPAAIAAHQHAGRVEPVRLGVRLGEATARGVDAVNGPPLDAPLHAGEVRLGGLDIFLEIDSVGPVGHIRGQIQNRTDQPIAVAALVFGFRWKRAGVEVAGRASGSYRFLRNGWQSWSFNGALDLDDAGTPEFPSGAWLRGLHHAVGNPPLDRSGWHESDLVTVIADSTTGVSCLAAVMERGRSFGIVYVRRARGDLEVEIELRFDGILAAGEKWPLEPVRVALGEDPSVLLEDYAEQYGRFAGARAAAPFVAGWCSWYHFLHRVSEDDVLRNLDALTRVRDEIPVEVIQLDDGYQRAVGDWLETNEKFPRGIARLAEEIRAAGFTPGLWTAPFCCVPESQIYRDHSDWLLTDGAEPFRGLVHPLWSADGSVHVLDPSRDEVLQHLERLFGELVAMGFTYLKLDFLYSAAMQAGAADPALPRATRLRRGLEAIRRGAGEEAFLLGCGCPMGVAVGVVDGMRIGPDVAPSWRASDAFAIAGIEETLPSTRSAVRSVLTRAWMHRRLWLNDPDCLMACEDAELSEHEARTLATAIAVTGGMTVFSDDVPALGADRRRLLVETIEVARQVDAIGLPGASRALDLLDGEFPSRVLAASADTGFLAVFAASDDATNATLSIDARVAGPLQGVPSPRLDTKSPAGPKLPAAEDNHLVFSLAPHESSLVDLVRDVPLFVFCDFDGTFSVQDVGSTLARRHAGKERPRVWSRYESGEITAWEYNMEVLDGLRIPKSVLDEFLHTVELDPGARDLLSWCEARGVPFRIVSDGFDWNLNRLQQIHAVRFAYDANQLRYDRGRWRLAPGHPNPDCGCGTGTCKRGRIEQARKLRPDATFVHIGNGRVSDLCGALAADVVFAKDTLATWLEQRGEEFERFETLGDVIPELERILEGRLPGLPRAR